MMEALQERMKLIDSLDSKLEMKVKSMEDRIMEKLSATKATTEVVVSQPCGECDNIKQDLKARESEVRLLQDELNEREKKFIEYEQKNKLLCEELKNVRYENAIIADNLKQSSSSYETLRSRNEELGRQLMVDQQKVKQLVIDVADRDKALQVLNKERTDLSKKVDESLKQLNDMMTTIVERSNQSGGDEADTGTESGEPDIVIVHDSLFKAVKPEGLMRREKQKVVMKWAPKLKDALECVLSMHEKPKVVLLHVGTNDLTVTSEEEMLEAVQRIHEILDTRGIKFVFDYIIPTSTRINTAKAEVFNSKVVASVDENVYVARNDSFYWHGVKSTKHFEEDGIHLNDNGTKALVLQTKEVLTRALGIQVPSSYGNNRHNNRYRRGNSRH